MRQLPVPQEQRQEDGDGDNFGDDCDFCLRMATDENVDFDGDGVGDDCDNCPVNLNADQLNDDADELGNACDTRALRGGGEIKPPGQGCSHTPGAGWLTVGLLGLPFVRRRSR